VSVTEVPDAVALTIPVAVALTIGALSVAVNVFELIVSVPIDGLAAQIKPVDTLLP
jgi:hypothetical protein